MFLHIDATKKTNRAELKLPYGKKDVLKWEEKFGSSEKMLEKIDKLLRKNKISLKDLERVKVNPGPGVFTGTRVGVAVANALAWSLGIPDYPITPVYHRPPNITKVSYPHKSPSFFI